MVSIVFSKQIKILVFLLVPVLLVACTEKKFVVEIYKGFYLGSLLSEPKTISAIQNVKGALNKDWYAEIKVKSKNKIRTVKNCREYFSAFEAGMMPVEEKERAAYFEFALMCKAATKLVNAKPAMVSFLENFKLDKNSPKLLPKQFSMVTSEVENKKLMFDEALAYWGDVNKITEVKVISLISVVFKHENLEQELSLVAKADFNDDKVEDLLLISKDSISGGSYRAVRLFLITKYSNAGKYILLTQ